MYSFFLMPFRNTKAILRNKEILRFEFISQEENDAQPQRHSDYIYLKEFGHIHVEQDSLNDDRSFIRIRVSHQPTKNVLRQNIY